MLGWLTRPSFIILHVITSGRCGFYGKREYSGYCFDCHNRVELEGVSDSIWQARVIIACTAGETKAAKKGKIFKRATSGSARIIT